MSKLLRLTGIILSASMIFISLPSNTEAARCENKKIEYVERYCLDGRTHTKIGYSQKCYDDSGKPTVKIWSEERVSSGCVRP